MRKFISMLLVLVMVLTLFGCTADNKATSGTTTSAAVTTKPASTTTANATVKDPNARYKKVDIKPNKKYTFVYANWSDQNSFAVLVTKGFKAACEYYGINLVVMDNKQDPIQANTNADTAITMGANFYFQYNQDTAINNTIGVKLGKAGIKAFAIQVPMSNGDYVFPFYGVNNYDSGFEIGSLLGKKAAAKWGAGTEYLLWVMGYPESGKLFQDRAAGAIAGVKGNLSKVTVFEGSTEGKPDVARQRTADFLTAHPTGKILIWTHADAVALGEIAAVKAANRTNDVLLASNAADPSMMPEIRSSSSIVVGTIDFDPTNWGWDMVPNAIAWLNNNTEPKKSTQCSNVLITKENADLYYPQ